MYKGTKKDYANDWYDSSIIIITLLQPDAKFKWQAWHIEKKAWLHFVRVAKRQEKPSPFLRCNEMEFSSSDNDVIVSWFGRKLQVHQLLSW